MSAPENAPVPPSAAASWRPPSSADAGVRIVVPARDIARGTTISQADLATITMDGDPLSGTVTSANDLVGMQTRRVLHAGESVRIEVPPLDVVTFELIADGPVFEVKK